MNFKEKLQTVLQKLKLLDKAKANQLTNEEWGQIVNSYQQEYQATLQDDLAADQAQQSANTMTQEQMNQLQTTLNGIVNVQTNTEDPNAGGEGGEGTGTGAQANHQPATPENLLALAGAVQNLVNTMENRAADDRPTHTVVSSTTTFTGPADRSQFLFGIENPMFAMTSRWNQITANPRMAASMQDWDEETEGASFRRSVVSYSRSLQNRYAYLHTEGKLDPVRMAAGEFANDYSGVNTAGVGNQYVVLRQDALIARILQKRDLTQYFPVRYGIQDHDLVFNAFFSEVSQAYQPGEIFKGDMKIENEMGHVDDAMIKLKFGPMKELERLYIGYLNKEGSDPIKWNMIEFCIVNSLENAQVEQNKRRMRGIYTKPEVGVAGSYLNASTGIIHTLIRYHHEYKLMLHDSDAYRTYTSADMLDAVQEFVADVVESCTEDMDIERHVLYLNKLHQPWWIKNIRTRYGKDTDFTGPDSYLNVVPDNGTRIIWLPYLGQMKLMFMQEPGNLQFLEYIPGEMLSMKVKEDMELVKGWSTWKEGCSAAFTGRRFNAADKMKANNYEWQQIFMNKPVVDIAEDAVTMNAKNGFWQVTGANTAATALTDIENAKAGVAYIIECGSTANATTLGKAGKFADITEAYVPKKEGDYIMVILKGNGNFLELERQVDGVRKVNAALQPNIPGVR